MKNFHDDHHHHHHVVKDRKSFFLTRVKSCTDEQGDDEDATVKCATVSSITLQYKSKSRLIISTVAELYLFSDTAWFLRI